MQTVISAWFHVTARPRGSNTRDGNLGMDTRSDRYRYGDDFLSIDDTRTRLESRRVFFSPTDNSMGIRYFTTAIILGCKQVKMCSFCYINYDLF
jgi:hypothetical protein